MVASFSPRQPLHLLVIAESDEAAGRLTPVFADAPLTELLQEFVRADLGAGLFGDGLVDGCSELSGIAPEKIARIQMGSEQRFHSLPGD